MTSQPAGPSSGADEQKRQIVEDLTEVMMAIEGGNMRPAT